MPDSRAMETGSVTTGLGVEYLRRPIVLQAASPDREGRSVHVVDWALDAQLLVGFGLGSRFELGLAMPFVLTQRGSGVAGLTTTQAAPLSTAAVRDPRATLGYALFDADFGGWRSGGKARFTLSAPFGDEHLSAGDAGWVVAPGFTFDAEAGPAFAALDVGARLRETTTLANVRHGHQLSVGVGVGATWHRSPRVVTALEAWSLPSLVSQPDDFGDVTHVPAEWLLSASVWPRAWAQLQLGVGGALPLSNVAAYAPSGDVTTESAAALTAAELRCLLLVRITTEPERPRHPASADP
jgi:hypothetical protein